MAKKPTKGMMALKMAVLEKSTKDKKSDKGKKETLPEMMEYKNQLKSTNKAWSSQNKTKKK